MEEFVPGQIYSNLVKMLKYRNAEVGEVLELDTVIQKLNHYEFVTINGTRKDITKRDHASVIVVVILIAPNSKYANRSAEFKKLLAGLPKPKANESLEVMFISEQPLTIHVKKFLAQYRAENPKLHLEDYNYDYFMIEAPLHASVPKHIIASDEEVEEFCRLYYTSRDKFPKILQSDVIAVWLGVRPGMVVKIFRVSETAGQAIAWRVCVK